MATRAANLALRDLGIDRSQATTEPREPGDLRSLCPNVIEVQDDRIALAAIHAAAPPEDRLEVSEVASDRRVDVGAPRRLDRVAPPPPRASGRASAVAVDADHLAPGDLLIDRNERGAGGDQRGDTRGLLRDVVELQHDRVALAAIDARVSAEVLRTCARSDWMRARFAALDCSRCRSPRARK